jgi:response regulator of citrate/malate metabolism
MTIDQLPHNCKSNILIVDDHPFIIRVKNAITRYNPKNHEFFITEAKDCESAYNVITNPESDVLILLF